MEEQGHSSLSFDSSNDYSGLDQSYSPSEVPPTTPRRGSLGHSDISMDSSYSSVLDKSRSPYDFVSTPSRMGSAMYPPHDPSGGMPVAPPNSRQIMGTTHSFSMDGHIPYSLNQESGFYAPSRPRPYYQQSFDQPPVVIYFEVKVLISIHVSLSLVVHGR